MILMAAFVNLALDGIVYINGIFNVVFLEEFGESRAVTSWAGAAQISLVNAGGKKHGTVQLCTKIKTKPHRVWKNWIDKYLCMYT